MPPQDFDAMAEQLLSSIGSEIKRLRKQKDLSQADLAKATGISRAYLSDIETKSVNVSVKNLVLIASALDVRIVELLQLAEKRTGSATAEVGSSTLKTFAADRRA